MNRFRWSNSLEELEICYLHRGAPGDLKCINGGEITSLGRSFFEISNRTKIPYHRIRTIKKGEAIIFAR